MRRGRERAILESVGADPNASTTAIKGNSKLARTTDEPPGSGGQIGSRNSK